ncbi:MAG: Modification methylase HaeIII [Phycisphaerae bacterium]|nr:Modification methylase HaeIII [Phycisphaerae bacterium]
MQAISLFSGCGGLDYGVEAAGFRVVLQTDFDRHSCDTLRANGSQQVLEVDIANVSTADIKRAVGSKLSSIDLLVGGPPCQPFSKSGYWVNGDTQRLKDARASTLTEYLRIVEEVRPKAFLLENVQGINYNGKEEGFRFLLAKIAEINSRTGANYTPSWQVLNAADYGVPQQRYRFFLVAFRDGTKFRFPDPTHRSEDGDARALFDEPRLPYARAWDAIGHLRPAAGEILGVGGQWGELLPSIPEGHNYLWHTDRGGGLALFGWRTRFWCFLLKLAKQLPSWTLQAQPGSAIGPFHWENRRLSWREMAALQTFPERFVISGPRVEIQRQIGNAVPSLLTEVLSRSIARQLGAALKADDPPVLSVRRATSVPAPEPILPVPEKYHHFIGQHAAHPGTGKGPAYSNGKLQGPPAEANGMSLHIL